MFRLLCLLLLIMPALAKQTDPVLILLNGTGSSGKSSIGHLLEKRLDRAFFLSEEKLVLLTYLEIMQQQQLQSALPLITLADFLRFRDSLPNYLAQDLKREFRRQSSVLIPAQTSEQIQLATAQGYKFIILDNSFWTPKHIQDWQKLSLGYRIFHVVVYCPPGSLLRHVQARNHLPDRFEHRDLALPLKMYFSMYLPTRQAPFIDCLQLEQIRRDLQACANYQKELKGHPLDYTSYLLAFKQHKEVKIAPFFTYDMQVNTAQLSSQQCVEHIVRRLFSRYPQPLSQIPESRIRLRQRFAG